MELCQIMFPVKNHLQRYSNSETYGRISIPTYELNISNFPGSKGEKNNQFKKKRKHFKRETGENCFYNKRLAFKIHYSN